MMRDFTVRMQWVVAKATNGHEAAGEARAYLPNSNLRMSSSGRPALRIFSWVAARSYEVR
jgi:hypothetical protein